MAEELKFRQIAVAVTLGPPNHWSASGEVLRLYGLGEDGAVYQYAPEGEAQVPGGAWKKMSMARLP
jgi:hypothetical protein